MDHDDSPQTFLSIDKTAAELGLPAAWLKAEALQGRLPCIRAGRRLFFSRESVERVLLKRAELTVRDPNVREGQDPGHRISPGATGEDENS